MAKKIQKNQSVSLGAIGRLLSEQTTVILEAVEKRLEKFENRQDTKIDQLKISIDRFVHLYTKHDQEFTVMKAEIN